MSTPRRRSTDRGFHPRENWHRDVWLLVITGALLLAVIAISGTATTADNAANGARRAARDAQQGLADYKLLASQRRVLLRSEIATTRRLTLRIAKIARERDADNRRAINREAVLISVNRADERRIASLQQSDAANSARNEYDACVQVEAVKRGLRLNFHILIPRPERLPPAQRRLILRLESRFAAHRCSPP